MAELTPEEEDSLEQATNPRPKPDGNTPEGVGLSLFYDNSNSFPAARGYSGKSKFASRADHRHPLCINPLQKPMRIGKLPRGLVYTFSSAGNMGVYGALGYPSQKLLDKCNTYALGNHCHAYGFVDQYQGTSPWRSMPDGVYPTGGVWTQTTEGRTNQNDSGTTCTRGDSTTEKSGHQGTSPFPARSDHSHPLNVADLLCVGNTDGALGGTGSAKDTIKAVGQTGGATGSVGDLPFYARVDHTHPYKYLASTGADATNSFYNTCMDGGKLVVTSLTGNNAYSVKNTKNATADAVASAKGFCGTSLFPARSDHSHPLNVFNQSISGNTSVDVRTIVKPIGMTGATGSYSQYISCGLATTDTGYDTKSKSVIMRCLGISPYYARADHSHPIPVDTAAVTSSSEKSGYGVVTVANETSNCSLPTDISNQRINAEGKTLRYAKSSLFNLQTYPRTFSVNCCTRVVTYGKDNYFFFRTFTFNKWGLLQSVGGENSYCKCMITS